MRSQLAIWFVLSCGAAALIGIAAAELQIAEIRPVVISSLVTGSVVGAALLFLMRLCELQTSKVVLPLAIFCGITAVVAQHGWLYQHYRSEWRRIDRENPAVAMFREQSGPASLTEYFTIEASPKRFVYWILDAALVAVATVVVLRWAAGSTRQPAVDRTDPDAS